MYYLVPPAEEDTGTFEQGDGFGGGRERGGNWFCKEGMEIPTVIHLEVYC